MLGSKSIVILLSKVFGRHERTNIYESEAKVHENSVFLYKSGEANFILKNRVFDYFYVAGLPIIAFGLIPHFYLAYIVAIIFGPRRIITNNYLTLRADLLPHSE